jgi:hypothetical protein
MALSKNISNRAVWAFADQVLASHENPRVTFPLKKRNYHIEWDKIPNPGFIDYSREVN